MEEIVKQYGFQSIKEFNTMVANVNLVGHDKIKAFKDWQENDGTIEGLLKLETLPLVLKNEKEFPRFWFEGNLAFFWVNNLEDLQRVFKQYEGQMTKDQILDSSVNVDDDLDNFGLRREHKGNVTLRQFLTNNDVEI